MFRYYISKCRWQKLSDHFKLSTLSCLVFNLWVIFPLVAMFSFQCKQGLLMAPLVFRVWKHQYLLSSISQHPLFWQECCHSISDRPRHLDCVYFWRGRIEVIESLQKNPGFNPRSSWCQVKSCFVLYNLYSINVSCHVAKVLWAHIGQKI